MLLRGNKGKGREKGKMKKTEGYVVYYHIIIMILLCGLK